jgi:hypothetical protein
MTSSNESNIKDDHPPFDDDCGSPRIMSITEMNDFIARIDAEAERMQHEIAIALEDYNNVDNNLDNESETSNLDLYGMATEMLESLGDKENQTKRPPKLSLGNFLAASRSPLASTPCMVNTSFNRSPFDASEHSIIDLKQIMASHSKFSFENETPTPEDEISKTEESMRKLKQLEDLTCEDKAQTPEIIGDELIRSKTIEIHDKDNNNLTSSISEQISSAELICISPSVVQSPKVASPLKENDPYEWAYEVWREHGLMGRQNNQTKRHANVVIDQSTPKPVHQGLDWMEWDLSPLDDMSLSKRKSSLSKGADRAKEFARYSSGTFHDVLSSWKKGLSESARLRKPEQFQDLLRKWREARQQREASGQKRAMKYAQEAKANLQHILKVWHESQGAEFEIWAHEHAKSEEECRELMRSWSNSHANSQSKEAQTNITQLSNVDMLIQQWRQSHLSEFEEWARQQAHSSDEFHEILRHWQELSAYDNSYFSPSGRGIQDLNEIHKGARTFSPHSKSRESKIQKSIIMASHDTGEEIDYVAKFSPFPSPIVNKQTHTSIFETTVRTEAMLDTQKMVTKTRKQFNETCEKTPLNNQNQNKSFENKEENDVSFCSVNVSDMQISRNFHSKDLDSYQNMVIEYQDKHWSGSLNALDLATSLNFSRKLHRCRISRLAIDEKEMIDVDKGPRKLVELRICGWFSLSHLEYLDLALTGRLNVQPDRCTQSRSQSYQAFRNYAPAKHNVNNVLSCKNMTSNYEAENANEKSFKEVSNLVTMWQENHFERFTGERRAQEISRHKSEGFDRLISLWRKSSMLARKEDDEKAHESRRVYTKGNRNAYESDPNNLKVSSAKLETIQEAKLDEKSSSISRMKRKFNSVCLAGKIEKVSLFLREKQLPDSQKNFPCQVASRSKVIQYYGVYFSECLNALDLAIQSKNQKSSDRRVAIKEIVMEDISHNGDKRLKVKICFP